MTEGPSDSGRVTVQPIAELFTSAVTALWATTYSIDLGLFNEFLLSRLGDPPLNVAVLADQRRLTASLERIPAERADSLAAVNRRWLLRGVRASGAFHPKSYLAVTRSGATLLVGSGNLSTGGLDEGKELFTTFRSGTPVGEAAIGAWRSWMRHLVGLVSDTTLAARFEDLETRIPSMAGAESVDSIPLLHNIGTPIVGQFAAAVGDAGTRVEELWLAAPFYDADAAAVASLISTFRPRLVCVFVTGSTSVNGERLADRLKASGASITVTAYEPDRFVHGKLIGVVAGDRAWLLSGSANLSRAALMLAPTTNGNFELAVLASMGAAELRATFVPPSMTLAGGSLESLRALTFRAELAPETPAVRLAKATALAGGRVEVTSDPPAAEGWLLDDLTSTEPLKRDGNGRSVTDGSLSGRLVQIVDDHQYVLSNRVVVDDPAALEATLTSGSSRSREDRPAELTQGDLETPLGQAFTWLHRHLVMDASERVTSTGGSGGVAASEAGQQGDDDLWERLEREQLARDARAGIYSRIMRRQAIGAVEPIIEFLEALRAGTSSEPSLRQRGSLLEWLLGEPVADATEDVERPVRRWAAATRIRVRARNLLRRWAAAQTDPRLQWVDSLAPAGNFAMIACAFAHLRLDLTRSPERVELTAEDLDGLWVEWLRPVAGTGQGDGWLDQLDEAVGALAYDRMPEWLPEAVAALCWLIVRPGSEYRERVVAFQPVLVAALAHELLEPTEMTARYLSVITGSPVSRSDVDEQLLAAATFIDDALWCERTTKDLRLDALRLEAPPGSKAIEVRLTVSGIAEPLLDPRVPRLVAAARHYRKKDGIAVFGINVGWRVVFVTGQRIGFLPNRAAEAMDSVLPVSYADFEELAARGGVLADLFPVH